MNMHAAIGKYYTATSVDTNLWVRMENCGETGGKSPPEGSQAWVEALAEAAVPAKPKNAKDEWYPQQQGMLGDWGFAQDQSLC